MTRLALSQLLEQLQAILHAIPLLKKKGYHLPILGLDNSSIDSISGLANFKDLVRKEIEVLGQHLSKADQSSNFSTNASYLIAVWNEIISAPPPINAIGKVFPSPTKDIPQTKRGKTNTPSTGTAKVDVVANGGRTWIRVNTIRNERLMAEFHEFDSYLTDSEEETENPAADYSYFPTDQDNSLLRMGRALIGASLAVPTTIERPNIVLRLTRLNPAKGHDPRISQVIEDLQQLGLDVQLGEHPFRTIADSDQDLSSIPYQPTNRVNLDLSVLIALVSDLTHAELPTNGETAKTRFGMPAHIRNGKTTEEATSHRNRSDVLGLEDGFTQHSRALYVQCLQEMDHGVINEIVERLSAAGPLENVQFWTTEEARDRALQILEKVGGPNERRRAQLMFYDDTKGEEDSISYSASDFWKDSRYPSTFFPSLLPIRIHKSEKYYEGEASRITSLFQSRLVQTCHYFLMHAATPHPRTLQKDGEMDRAAASNPNAKLTVHTVESLLVGGYKGMTTITANKASVKTLLREMKRIENRDSTSSPDTPHLRVRSDNDTENANFAVIWVIEPRSLAEQMRLDRPT